MLLDLAQSSFVHLHRPGVTVSEGNTPIVIALLNSLASRQGGADAVKALRNALPRIFEMNFLAADEVGRVIGAWLSGSRILL